MAESNLKKFFEGLREKARDMVTLDVVTITGSITIESTMADDGGKKVFSLENLLGNIEASAVTQDSDLAVVAYTHIGLDKDAINFVSKDLGEGQLPLVEAHKEMVKTSQESRLALVKAVKELVTL